MFDETELINRFKFHPSDTEAKVQAHEKVRQLCLNTAIYLNDLIPDNREKALAYTNLEQVMFWANAALAREGSDA